MAVFIGLAIHFVFYICGISVSFQADTLKHRSEIINSLTPQEFSQLFDGLKHCEYITQCKVTFTTYVFRTLLPLITHCSLAVFKEGPGVTLFPS